MRHARARSLAARSGRGETQPFRPAAWVFVSAVLALVSCAHPADAQPRLTNGVKFGDGRVHPYLDVETRYDSHAYFLEATSTMPDRFVPEVITHLRPGLKVELPTRSVSVSMEGNLEYLLFTGLVSRESMKHSRLQADALLQADLKRQSAWEATVADQFRYSDRTTNASLGVGVLSLFNEARASGLIRPGTRALEIAPQVHWTLEQFQPLQSYAPEYVNIASTSYQNLGVGVEGRWRFLPKTLVVAETTFDLRAYAAIETNTEPLRLWRTSVGLTGLLSTKLAVIAKLGWAHEFRTSPLLGTGRARPSTPVAHAELTYVPMESASVKAGYLRGLDPAPGLRLGATDRAYLTGRLLILSRLQLRATAQYEYLSFYADQPRNDRAGTVELSAEYALKAWLVATVGYTLTVRRSDVVGLTPEPLPGLNYARNEGYLRLRLTY